MQIKSLNHLIKGEKSPSNLQEIVKTLCPSINTMVEGILKTSTQEEKNKLNPIIQEIQSCNKNLEKLQDIPACLIKLEQAMNKLGSLPKYDNIIKLFDDVQSLALSTEQIIKHSGALSLNAQDTNAMNSLTNEGKNLGIIMKKFKGRAKYLLPGNEQCESSIQKLEQNISELDNLSMSAAVGILEIVPEKTHQQAQEDMVEIGKHIGLSIQNMLKSVKEKNFGQLGDYAFKTANLLEEAKLNAMQIVGTTSNQDVQTTLLGHTKDIAEYTLALMNISSDLTIDNGINNSTFFFSIFIFIP